MKLEFDKLQMKDDVLIRRLETVDQVLLPKSLRDRVYTELQCGMGHLGADRVGELECRKTSRSIFSINVLV